MNLIRHLPEVGTPQTSSQVLCLLVSVPVPQPCTSPAFFRRKRSSALRRQSLKQELGSRKLKPLRRPPIKEPHTNTCKTDIPKLCLHLRKNTCNSTMLQRCSCTSCRKLLADPLGGSRDPAPKKHRDGIIHGAQSVHFVLGIRIS